MTWNDREITNPVLRALAVEFLFGVAAPVLICVVLPLGLVLHPLFRLFGLVGTVRPEPNGQFSIIIDKESFHRA